MNNNALVFYLYIIVTLLFLLPLFYFITNELLQMITSLYFYKTKQNLFQIGTKEFIYIFNLYMKRNEWFICISMLENLYKNQKLIHLRIILIYLAFCYEKLSYLNIAKYYYLQVLLYEPSNIYVLNKLAYIYKLSNESEKLNDIYQRINLIKNN